MDYNDYEKQEVAFKFQICIYKSATLHGDKDEHHQIFKRRFKGKVVLVLN
jgi:hypothetical protein